MYLQVHKCTRTGEDLDQEELGWLRVVQNRLEPRMSELPPAPEALLKVIRCRLLPVETIVTHEGALGQFRGDRRTVWTLVFGVNKI